MVSVGAGEAMAALLGPVGQAAQATETMRRPPVQHAAGLGKQRGFRARQERGERTQLLEAVFGAAIEHRRLVVPRQVDGK